MAAEPRFQEENLIYLVYISKGVYKRVPLCPEDVQLDLDLGLWRIGGQVFKIGEAMLTFRPAEGVTIGVFDRTRETQMQNMFYAERSVATPT